MFPPEDFEILNGTITEERIEQYGSAEKTINALKAQGRKIENGLINIYPVHKVKNPKNYVSVNYLAINVYNILDYTFANIEKSPQKVLKARKGYYMTREKFIGDGGCLYGLAYQMDRHLSGPSSAVSGLYAEVKGLKNEMKRAIPVLEKIMSEN